MSTEFGVPLFYFDFTGIQEEDRQSTQDSIDETIKQLIVGGMELAPKAYMISKYFYASLCYHHKFLDDTICSSDRLRQSPLFQHCSENHMKLAVIKYPWNSTRETPSRTGLPPHTVMLSELCTIQEKLNNFRDDIKNTFITELDKRDTGGSMNHTSKILEKIKNSHIRILDRLERIGIDSNSDKKENQGELKNMFGAGADIEPGRSRTMTLLQRRPTHPPTKTEASRHDLCAVHHNVALW